MKHILLVALYLYLTACGIADPTDTNNDNTFQINDPPVTTKDPLGPVAFNNDIIDPQVRFASYSTQAQRVSIIDPIEKNEVWGKQTNIYDYAIPHPGYTGVTLFKGSELLILSQNSEKSVNLNENFSHMAIGSSNVAYAFANQTGDKIEILRSLGFGNWQHEVFQIPWGVDDSTDQVFETKVSLPLASIFINDGQKLLIFNPADGKYLWLEAESQNSLLVMNNSFCEGNSNTDFNNVFRYVIYDRQNVVAIAGDYQGKLTMIQLNDTCHDYNTSNQLMLSNNSPILHIKAIKPGELLVSQSNGHLKKVTYNISGFGSEIIDYPNICDYPAGVLPMRNEFLLLACIPKTNSSTELDERFYQLYDMSNNAVINDWQANNKFSGIGVDRNTLTLHRMLESSLGILQSIDLETGVVYEKSGLFLQDILD